MTLLPLDCTKLAKAEQHVGGLVFGTCMKKDEICELVWRPKGCSPWVKFC